MGNNIFYKQTTMTQIIVAPGKTVVKDAAGNVMIKDNLKWSASASGCAFGICADIKTADNALTCDSEGNCMLKDKLLSFGGSYKGNSVSVYSADNALTCDAAGDCMLGKPVKKTPAEVQQVLKAKGKCPMNYDWNKIAGGWRCSGGTHFMTDAQVAAM